MHVAVFIQLHYNIPDEESRETSCGEEHHQRAISLEPSIAYSAVKTCQDDATKVNKL